MATHEADRADRADRADKGLERYLLDGERIVVALHQHWAKITGPVALAVAGLILALVVDAKAPQSVGVVTNVVWIGWILLLLWTLWQVLAWRHDWFVATDKRLLLTYGLISRRVAMMPLMKVTDMSYQRSIPGRVLGYGQFIMESAGQEQALRDVRWIPQPDHTYRAICAEMFGVEDRDRVLVSVAHSRAIPLRQNDPPGESLYRSEDLRRQRRSGDTGPIPLYPPEADD